MSRMRGWRARSIPIVQAAVLEDFVAAPLCLACYRRCDPTAGHMCLGDRVSGRRSSWKMFPLAQALLQFECHRRCLPDWCFSET